ncbi:MAG TPA: hypothetical protein VMU16_10825 [Candidatus Binataceae bacterium]|nr:hypothetical protein [Candidatus Binataceae bacterium]
MNVTKEKIAAFVSLIVVAIVPSSIFAQAVTTYTTNSKSIVLMPYVDDFGMYDAGGNLINDLPKACGTSDPFPVVYANVEAFRGMGNDYGVIGISSHGWVRPETGQVEIMTREPVPPLGAPMDQKDINDVLDKYLGSLERPPEDKDTTPYFAITPAFVSHYASPYAVKVGPNSYGYERLNYVAACESDANPTMAAAFVGDESMGAYFGYTEKAKAWQEDTTAFDLFGVLTNFKLTDDQRTTSKAYAQAGTDGGFSLDSVSDQNLAIGGPIVNGGFEDTDTNGSHLVGWTRHFEPNAGAMKDGHFCGDGDTVCTPAAGDEASKATRDEAKTGKYSAELGRWENSKGPPGTDICTDSVDKQESAGDDQIYQDVTLGKRTANGGPKSFTLTFDYIRSPPQSLTLSPLLELEL